MRRHAGLVAVVLALSACGSPASPTASVTPAASGSATGSGSAVPSASVTPSATRSTSASPTGSATPGASDAPADPYVVEAGDTLYRIALNHGVSLAQLVTWNVDRYPSLADDTSTIRVGWELVVGGGGPVPSAPAATSVPTAPPPVASGCHAGSRTATGAAQVFDRVPTDEQAVALTFDMGGRLDPGVDILNFLIANGVCATLFPTGAMTQTPQGQAVMAIVRAHPELFEVGNHTMFHCDLVRGGSGSPTTAPCAGGPPSADRIRTELTDAAAIIRDATGQDPAPYWRPPYGSWNQGVIDAAASVGYPYTFMWDIDTIDWKPIADGGPNASQIASNVVSRAVAGSNVLMHLGGYETLAALPTMVQGLRDRGFTITSLSDLLD